MTRTFDHAGYYETRMLLAVVAIAVASWFLLKKNDRRYWIMLLSGVLFQAGVEWFLAAFGLRGPGYSLSIFGLELHGLAAWVLQGVAEGGILCMMSYWFLDIVRRPRGERQRTGYLAVCALIVVLASVVGYLARGQAITSPRPMFATPIPTIIYTFGVIMGLVITWLKDRDAYHYLGLWWVGCVVYGVLTFSTLQLWGARYIAERTVDGGFVAASLSEQFWVMLYAHLWEFASGKIYYFAIPFAVGLLKLPPRPR